MANLENSLASILGDNPNERDIHSFLKQNPEIVKRTFTTSWNYSEVFPEVWLGSDLRLDFLVLCADSGSWTAHIIELKSPSEALYTKRENETSALRLVKKQLEERNQWFDENMDYFRDTLAKLVGKDDPGSQCSNVAVHELATTELRDRKTVIWRRFHAVIGRASTLTPEERDRRRAQIRARVWGAPEILTYDRFLHAARVEDS